ncbi:MAG: flagellar hook-associated protein FlgK [Betaproteobacteria bacterium]|nr:flagellar hook-associated protein FlgK [Betaproteobacteria bacterium]MCL2885320.1 flagellar hook-associated protein FlgK [Betaproteobacteria bacterium]
MSSGFFSIGVTGMNAAQLNLLATQHNVVNATTPGYTRQRAMQATNIPVMTGAGALGMGVHVQTISRMYDSYLTQQVNTAQTRVSQLDAFYSQIAQIDNMLADPSAGMSPALQGFFSGVQHVASDPSLISSRQAMISSAQTLIERFQALDNRLFEIRNEVNSRITDSVAEVNNYSTMIADINQRIILAEAGSGHSANDLLDQRDRLVAELNQMIRVTTTTNSDGSLNVFIGSGQQLVMGNLANQLVAMPSAGDSAKTVVGLRLPNGGTLEMPESLIIGGELGGLVEFRTKSLDAIENELGRLAASLSLTFNAQLALGQDLEGRIAGDSGFVGTLFSITTDTPLTVATNIHNTGSGSLSATFSPPVAPQPPDFSGNFYTELRASDYQVNFGAGGDWTVTRLSDNIQVAAGNGTGPISFDGIDLNIAALGNNGDRFVLKPYVDAAQNIAVDARIVADPRLITAGGPVGVTPGVANSGSFEISQGVVGVGYTAPAAPVTLQVTAANLQGVPGTWTAVYSDGTQVSGAGDIALNSGAARLVGFGYDNMYFTVAGTPPPAGADSFTLARNIDGIQDSRNAILLGNLQTQKTMDGGTATYQAAYGKLVADVGIRAREANVQLSAQTVILQQAQATRDALSGVNLDEEAANLLRYQQAYQASAKVLEIGSKLFDTLLSLR